LPSASAIWLNWRHALKGNQGSLREDVELFATEQKARDFADTTVTRHTTVDSDHGHIETRTTTTINDVEWLQECHDWPGLKAVIMIESSRETNGKTEHETRLYLTSLVTVAALIGPILRSHWSIENSLHWVMDMMFRDDECRVRTDYAPENFTTIRRPAHNLLWIATSKDSMRLRRKVAAWDYDFLASLIARWKTFTRFPCNSFMLFAPLEGWRQVKVTDHHAAVDYA
jgi:predicted transposase YbfD/YdcC